MQQKKNDVTSPPKIPPPPIIAQPSITLERMEFIEIATNKKSQGKPIHSRFQKVVLAILKNISHCSKLAKRVCKLYKNIMQFSI